jgi:hypothetical protein
MDIMVKLFQTREHGKRIIANFMAPPIDQQRSLERRRPPDCPEIRHEHSVIEKALWRELFKAGIV